MLKIQEFIRSNPEWRVLLSGEPYNLAVSEKTVAGRNLVILKYNQTTSDFSNEIVCECRGIILDADTAEVVCHPFHKFFNYGESHCANIDWDTSRCTQKIDGSIIKVVNLDGQFLISTNGVIDAFDCYLPENFGRPFDTFGELFIEGMKFYGLDMGDFPRLFKPGFTYMFELTSPWNQVVVQWRETKVWFIGVRDNSTGKEIFFKDSELADVFDTPEIYPLNSIDACVDAAKVLPDDEEGYVVVDASFNRVKIKSPKYVQLHYMAGNHIWSPSRVLDIIRSNEVSEYLAYFPKFKVAFDAIKGRIDAYVARLERLKSDIDGFCADNHPTKKDFAMWVMKDPERKAMSGFAFMYFDCSFGNSDRGIRSAMAFVEQMRTSQLADALGLKDDTGNRCG